jgi:hypothetical protein
MRRLDLLASDLFMLHLREILNEVAMKTTAQLVSRHLEPARRAKDRMVLVTILLLPWLAACASDSSHTSSGTNFGEITLETGSSGTCVSSPCRVYLAMPPGSGSFDVLAGGLKVGSFPAGETAALGSYWTGFTVFTIVGSDVGPTRLNVVGRK